MCGIVGFVGKKPAAPLLLEGLAKLEYRGYDSAGVALAEDAGLQVYKCKGRLQVLAQRVHAGIIGAILVIGGISLGIIALLASPFITALVKACTSSCVMRPFGPEPFTSSSGTPSSRANLRTEGEACGRPVRASG